MNQLSPVFSALGDPTRFAIVDRLLREGELSAGEISTSAAISPPAFSRHLKLLREAGLIRQRTDRQRRLYSVRPETVRQIAAWTMTYREFWEGSLDRLETALEQEMKNNG
ncbi:MAG: metalloregulator ArsR/SmtB family transcription factor [Pseudomonadota bacterium]